MIPNNTKVKIADGSITGIVTACNIRGVEPNIRVCYEVTWFVGGAYHSEYLESYEIKEHEETKVKAGMVNYNREVEKVSSTV
jgi:hypothetical protein